MDENGTPYIFEYKFKITSLDDFESSLKTNVYTLKELNYNDEGELLSPYWIKAKDLTDTSVKTYPYIKDFGAIFKLNT